MTAPIAFIIAGSGFCLAMILSPDALTGAMFGILGLAMFGLAVVFAGDRA